MFKAYQRNIKYSRPPESLGYEGGYNEFKATTEYQNMISKYPSPYAFPEVPLSPTSSQKPIVAKEPSMYMTTSQADYCHPSIQAQRAASKSFQKKAYESPFKSKRR